MRRFVDGGVWRSATTPQEKTQREKTGEVTRSFHAASRAMLDWDWPRVKKVVARVDRKSWMKRTVVDCPNRKGVQVGGRVITGDGGSWLGMEIRETKRGGGGRVNLVGDGWRWLDFCDDFFGG